MKKRQVLSYLGVVLASSIVLCALVYTFILLTGLTSYIPVRGEIVPQQRQSISSRVAGIVDSVPFQNGDHVKKGDVVLTIDDRAIRGEIEANRARSASLRERMDLLKSQLAIQDQGLIEFERYSQRVIGEAKKRSSIGSLAAADLADLIYAKRVEGRQLQEKKYELLSDTISAQNDFDLLQTKESALEVELADCTIRAGFDGVIVDSDDRQKAGLFVDAGEVIQQIFSSENLYAEVRLPETRLMKFSIGQKAELFVDALPYTKFRTFAGRLTSITPAKSKEGDNYYLGKILVDDPDFRARIGKLWTTRSLDFNLALEARIYVGDSLGLDYLFGSN